MSLKEQILSRSNIYSAIYCMESYVFEKGLLNTNENVCSLEGRIIANNDLELYYALGDKFNHKLIRDVINLCIKRLTEILSSNDELFEISVYFKLKSYDKDNHVINQPEKYSMVLMTLIKKIDRWNSGVPVFLPMMMRTSAIFRIFQNLYLIISMATCQVLTFNICSSVGRHNTRSIHRM